LPTYEIIYLIAKPDFKLVPKSNGVGDVWEFTQEMKNGHPAPFPVALIDRIIDSTSAQIILDPFLKIPNHNYLIIRPSFKKI